VVVAHHKFPNPPPPEVLAEVGADVTVLPTGTRLWRLYPSGGNHPTTWSTLRHFGPTDARFDHHLPPAHNDPVRAVAYFGALGPLCVAERFQRTRRIDRRHPDRLRLAGFDLAAPLALADLRRLWPTRAGASQAVATGPRSRSRRWAIAIHEAFGGRIDGIVYRSSMYGGETAVTVWERGVGAFPATAVLDVTLDDPQLTVALINASRSIGYDVF
jgi:RES domain